MTNEKAIKTIESRTFWDYIDPELRKALDMAITALYALQESGKNDPLTLDELRQMDGQRVYCVSFITQGLNVWGTVFMREIVSHVLALKNGELRYFLADTYGTTWLAYRRPRERKEQANE